MACTVLSEIMQYALHYIHYIIALTNLMLLVFKKNKVYIYIYIYTLEQAFVRVASETTNELFTNQYNLSVSISCSGLSEVPGFTV